ncbi:MAG: acetylxylan esterase [Gemmataceae bacterium]
MQRKMVLVFMATVSCATHRAEAQDLAEAIRKLDGNVVVLGKVRQPPLAGMLSRDAEARIRIANEEDRIAWSKVASREDWERFRDTRLMALRASLGMRGDRPKADNLLISKTTSHAGIEIDHLIYETRRGLFVTAHLYRPAKSKQSRPAILLISSHFGNKSSGVHQDMALTWARAGCVVLVPDHLGHGERRQHPFNEDDPHSYHFRHDLGMQLDLAGESLMGWLVQDLMAGIDVLRSRREVDPNRIVAISDPAGGGDVAAVLAALDDRLAGAMVQNFGGPEPEDAYPLPRDAERSFNFAGFGSWEPTRNLRNSARDGFLPWSIVASIAPRKLIYYHEFYWDAASDPVWKRLKQTYGYFGKADALVGIGGRGFVVGTPPENTHWLPENRALLYPTLERWFGVPNPDKELSDRLPEASLNCWTPTLTKELQPRSAHAILADLAADRLKEARKRRESLPSEANKNELRKALRSRIGNMDPEQEALDLSARIPATLLGEAEIRRLHLQTEPGIVVPTLLLMPSAKKNVKPPVVIAIAQSGKQEFLKQHSSEIASLLHAGIVVCLADLRGTGETQPSGSRDRRSHASEVAATYGMVGDTLLAGRVRDVRSIIRRLAKMPDVDAGRIALWGDSFAEVSLPDADLKVPYSRNTPRPRRTDGWPCRRSHRIARTECESPADPCWPLRFSFGFRSSFVYLPNDAIIPGLFTIGDVPDLLASLAPTPTRVRSAVDASNRVVPEKNIRHRLQTAFDAYDTARAREQFDAQQQFNAIDDARWLAETLRK